MGPYYDVQFREKLVMAYIYIYCFSNISYILRALKIFVCVYIKM